MSEQKYLLHDLIVPCDDCPVTNDVPCDKELPEPRWCFIKLMSDERMRAENE